MTHDELYAAAGDAIDRLVADNSVDVDTRLESLALLAEHIESLTADLIIREKLE